MSRGKRGSGIVNARRSRRRQKKMVRGIDLERDDGDFVLGDIVVMSPWE
jgi:hypothetical protein